MPRAFPLSLLVGLLASIPTAALFTGCQEPSEDFRDWLKTSGGIPTGLVSPDNVFSNIVSVNTKLARTWASSGAPNPGPRVFSVNVPTDLPLGQQCGKGVHFAGHVNRAEEVDRTWPKSCSATRNEGKTFLTFLFFDALSCLQDDNVTPNPPAAQ